MRSQQDRESIALDWHQSSKSSQNRPQEKLISGYAALDRELDTMAFILAGGRGARLRPLTNDCCKPAVPFAACCRIIDFTLSNCINSGIRRIGILTQYKQNTLISHVRDCWSNADCRLHDFIDILPAHRETDLEGYRGTADAITQNLALLRKHTPRHTLILAGDHIYKADYRRLIRQHMSSEADVTVACCEVPLQEANRYGIVSIDHQQRITRFSEKPAVADPLPDKPEAALASMGIYLFNTQRLLELLGSDASPHYASCDFGKDVFPSLIHLEKVFAYDFTRGQQQHYWADVGTIDSYYRANMNLLDPNSDLQLNDPDWPIQVPYKASMPSRLCVDSLGEGGSISDCIIASGCRTMGSRIKHSILFKDVTVDEHCLIENSLLLPGARIGKQCRLFNTIVDSGVTVPDGTTVGLDIRADAHIWQISESGITVVAEAAGKAVPDAESGRSVLQNRPEVCATGINHEQPVTNETIENDSMNNESMDILPMARAAN